MALISIAIMIFIIFLLFSILKIPNNNYRNYRRPFKRYYRKNKYYKKIKKDITEERLANMDSGNISIKKIMNIEETKIFFSILKIHQNRHPVFLCELHCPIETSECKARQ